MGKKQVEKQPDVKFDVEQFSFIKSTNKALGFIGQMINRFRILQPPPNQNHIIAAAVKCTANSLHTLIGHQVIGNGKYHLFHPAQCNIPSWSLVIVSLSSKLRKTVVISSAFSAGKLSKKDMYSQEPEINFLFISLFQKS